VGYVQDGAKSSDGGEMNGYKRILYQAQRELERCQSLMDESKIIADAGEYDRYVAHSMACEDVITYVTQKMEAFHENS